VDNQVVEPEVDIAGQEGEEGDNKEERDAKPSTVTTIVKDSLRSFVPKTPYPERLKAPKKNVQFAEILEVFKQVQINIPFLDAIQKVPSYAKFFTTFFPPYKNFVLKISRQIPKKQHLRGVECYLPFVESLISCLVGSWAISSQSSTGTTSSLNNCRKSPHKSSSMSYLMLPTLYQSSSISTHKSISSQKE
jgi:hypothetical protein